MKLRVQVLRPLAMEPCHWSEWYVGVSLWTGKASHNASNAWGVTAGKMGRNSSTTKGELSSSYAEFLAM